MYVYMYNIVSTFLSPLSTCSMPIAHTGIINYYLFAIYVPVFPGVSLMGGASLVVGGVSVFVGNA